MQAKFIHHQTEDRGYHHALAAFSSGKKPCYCLNRKFVGPFQTELAHIRIVRILVTEPQHNSVIVILQAFIWKCSIRIQAGALAILHEVLMVFLSPSMKFQDYTPTGPRFLPSTSFAVHNSTINTPFDVTLSEILTAS